jgi:hypothetical protein
LADPCWFSSTGVYSISEYKKISADLGGGGGVEKEEEKKEEGQKIKGKMGLKE